MCDTQATIDNAWMLTYNGYIPTPILIYIYIHGFIFWIIISCLNLLQQCILYRDWYRKKVS